MKKLILVALLLSGCTKFSPECVKIGDTYQSVVDACGKPGRVTHRAGWVFTAEYGKYDERYLLIMFDQDRVNYFKFKSLENGEMEKWEEEK